MQKASPHCLNHNRTVVVKGQERRNTFMKLSAFACIVPVVSIFADIVFPRRFSDHRRVAPPSTRNGTVTCALHVRQSP
jgi:hypothetical protein